MGNNKVKAVGVILVILAIAFTFFMLTGKDDGRKPEEPDINETETLTESERESLVMEINENADDRADIDDETARKIMNLQINIPDVIRDTYFDGNTEKLEEELTDYLVENDFYLDVTRANCQYEVTVDHFKKIVYLEFSVDDGYGTHITVEYDQNDGWLKFNYY